MKSVCRVGGVLAVSVFLAAALFAGEPAKPKAKSKKPAATKKSKAAPPAAKTTPGPQSPLTTQPAAAPRPFSLRPGTRSLFPGAQAPRGTGGTEHKAPEWRPMPATTGTLGLFTLEVGDTLPKKAVSISGYANKISREPGSISVVSAGWTVAAGLHDRVNVYFQFEPHRHVHASRPGRLSFNSPLANPQFGTTIYRSLTSAVGSAPGYVEDFPFANANGGGVGEVTLGMKFGVWSEWRGDPLSFSIRNDFIIPTRTILSDLLDNQGQSGQFNNNVGVAVSKTFRDLITGAFNFNYRFTRDPRFGGTRALEQADQARFGVGFLMFPQKRVQLMTEYSALIFTGAHTANTSFGPRNSVEGLWGVRLYPYRNISIDLGYRQNISLSQHGDRHGLVVKVSTVYWPHQ